MKDRKLETFTYMGLGFPIELIDVPMKKVFDEWVMDIDMNKFQLFIFKGLIHKPSGLSGREMKFMRKFLQMTTTELGNKLGVSHPAILKWEKEASRMSPAQEIYFRMVCVESLNTQEVVKIFDQIKPENLSESNEGQALLSIDMKDLKFVA